MAKHEYIIAGGHYYTETPEQALDHWAQERGWADAAQYRRLCGTLVRSGMPRVYQRILGQYNYVLISDGNGQLVNA